MCDSGILREGQQLAQQGEETSQARLSALREEIDRGLDELGRGLGVDGEEAFARVLDEIEHGN